MGVRQRTRTRRRVSLTWPVTQPFVASADTVGMHAILVVPRSTKIAHAFDGPLLQRMRRDPRAQHAGVLVIMPTTLTPPQLMCAASTWPQLLRKEAGVTRIAIVLGIAAYATNESILRGCVRTAAARRVELVFFHEAQLATDVVRAWCQRRLPRRKRVTTDSLVKLGERYAERNDVTGATHAFELAERAAREEPELPPEPFWRGQTHTVNLRKRSQA